MPEETPRKEIPSQKEFLRILAAAGPSQRPLILLLIHTLARIEEILRLRWEDISFEKQTITLWTRKRKGGNLEPRYIPMNQELYNLLWSMWQRKTQNNWVLYNERTNSRYNHRPKFMRSLCRRASVKHYGFHSIRHFIATYLHVIMKIPTGVIGNLLGHKSKRTTEIYLHSVDEAAREAIKKLEGIFAAKSETEEIRVLEEENFAGKGNRGSIC